MIEFTEKEQEDLFNVFMAALLYTDIKSTPHNPFVKKIGESREEQEAYEVLIDYTNRASYLAEKFVSEQDLNVENKEVIADRDLMVSCDFGVLQQGEKDTKED